MSFSEQEQAIITAGLSNGKNKDEIKTALARYRLGFTPAPKPVVVEAPSYLARIGEEAKAGLSMAKESLMGLPKSDGGLSKTEAALQGVEGGLGIVQGLGRAVLSPTTPAAQDVVAPAAPYIAPVVEGIKGASEAVIGERATGIAGQALEAGGYLFGAGRLVPTLSKTASVAEGAMGKMATMAGKADAPQMVSGVQNTTLDAILKQPFRTAERIKTNVAEIKRVADEYSNFPETSKQLVTMGVPRDVTKSLGETNTATLDLKKRMFNKAENGDTTALPSERPIMELAPVVSKQVTDVETTRQAIGRAIGQEVESIYKGQPVSTQPVKSALYDYVQDAGAKIADDGTIDLGGVTSFTGKKKTFVKEVFDYINALPSNISAQELMIIDDYLRGLKRDVLTDAREPLTYVSKIDGKKKDLINDIVEQVYKEVTVRAPNIRALRNEYRKMSDFKEEVERILRVSIDEGIDEVKMTGALRRVTSDAQSAGDVERILKELNQMSPTDVDIKSVLDFNNYLRKLYGAPETSMQGLLQETAGATPSGLKSNIVNALMEKARGTLGATIETQKQALKRFFQEVSKPQRGIINFGELMPERKGAKATPEAKARQDGSLPNNSTEKTVNSDIDTDVQKTDTSGGFDGGLMAEAKKYNSAEEFVNFPRIPFANKKFADIQERSIRRYVTDKENLLKEYLAKNTDAKTGHVVANADEARKLFTKEGYYGKDSSPAVHEASSQLAKDAFEKALNERPEEFVNMFAGGAGSGKTSAVSSVFGDMFSDAAATLDGTLSKMSTLERAITQIVKAGKTPRIYFPYRPAVDAWVGGVIKRMKNNPEEMGRIVPLEEFIKGHIGALKVIKSIVRDPKLFKNLRVVDNSAGPKSAKEVDISTEQGKVWIESLDYDAEQLRNELLEETRKLRDSGAITQEEYNMLTK